MRNDDPISYLEIRSAPKPFCSEFKTTTIIAPKSASIQHLFLITVTSRHRAKQRSYNSCMSNPFVEALIGGLFGEKGTDDGSFQSNMPILKNHETNVSVISTST